MSCRTITTKRKRAVKEATKDKRLCRAMIAYVLKVHGLSKKNASHACSSDAKYGIKSQYPTIVLYWILRSMTVSFRKFFLNKLIKD